MPRSCPKSRRLLVARVVEQGWSLTAAAEAAGVSERTVWRWLARWRAEGEAGLLDRSVAAATLASRLPPATVEAITALRRLRMTAAEIAEVLGLALSTVSALAEADRARQALPARAARAAQPLRAPPSGRARPRRHQAARPHLRARRRAPRRRRTARARSGRADGSAQRPASSTCTYGRRRTPGWPTPRCCPT